MLEKAIELEREGIEFYSKALTIVQHEQCRGLIQLLLEQEKNHIEEIKKISDELKPKSDWPKKESILPEDDMGNIFADAYENLDKMIKPSTDEREFLELCMAFELKGKEQYDKLADKTEDAREKEFYKKLSKEEEKHHQYLEQYCNYYWDTGMRMQD